MTNLALIAVLGLLVLLLLYVFFMSRRAARLGAIAKDVQEEVAAKLRREAEATEVIVGQIAGGVPADRAITAYQNDRAAILAHDRTDKPWAWGPDDLDQWRKLETARRGEDVNRRLIVPALTSSLVVLAIAAVSITICYNSLTPDQIPSSTSFEAGGETPLPIPFGMPSGSPPTLPESPGAPDTRSATSIAVPEALNPP